MVDGIPDSVRSVVWSSLADVNTMIEKNPGVYDVINFPIFLFIYV